MRNLSNIVSKANPVTRPSKFPRDLSIVESTEIVEPSSLEAVIPVVAVDEPAPGLAEVDLVALSYRRCRPYGGAP